jgi:hypothetical protein
MRCYEIKVGKYYHLTDLEILALREDFKSAMKKVKMLVDLTKESSYRLPSGLSREERRKWISDIGSKLLKEENEVDS